MNKLFCTYVITAIFGLGLTSGVYAQQSVVLLEKAAPADTATSNKPNPAAENILAEAAKTTRQQMSDAWWTGPMLAPSAGTLPPGHILAEPYFYDVTSPNNNSFGSLAYLLYGVAKGFTAGIIPTVGYNKVGGGGLSSSGLQFGDFTVVGQYGLRKYKQGSWLPAMALNVQQSFPTGKYNNLGNRPANGFGSGAYTIIVSWYNQTYFWLNNGRILRVRLNFSQSFSSNAAVSNVSVYGTQQGFRGHASPGWPFTVDAAAEYSLTRNWVLATDVAWRHTTNTSVTGYYDPSPGGGLPFVTTTNSGVSHGFIFAPAIEYNFNSSIGVLFGTRIIPQGYNMGHSFTPVVAINYVH